MKTRTALLTFCLVLFVSVGVVLATENPLVSVDSASVTGPISGVVSNTLSITASIAPVSSTLPVTYTWHTAWPNGVSFTQTHSSIGALVDTLELTPTMSGTYTFSVEVVQAGAWGCPTDSATAAMLFGGNASDWTRAGDCNWLLDSTDPVTVSLPSFSQGDWWNGTPVQTFGPAVITNVYGISIWQLRFSAVSNEHIFEAVIPEPTVFTVFLPMVRRDLKPAPAILPTSPACMTTADQAVLYFGGEVSMWNHLDIPGCAWFLNTHGQVINLAIQPGYRLDTPFGQEFGPKIINNTQTGGTLWKLP